MKKWIYVIVTDTEDSIEIVGKNDHHAIPLKDVLDKPKLSFWKMYILKKFIENAYGRLNKEYPEGPPVSDNPDNIEQGVEEQGQDDRGSSS